ncbi:hypothetical protein GS421_15370 [Rhodococcus hoagii]|nr:hypothetical protein [Prescottella equi]
MHEGFAAKPIRDVHLFARRGPRTSASRHRTTRARDQYDVDIVVNPADLEPDPHLDRMTRQFTRFATSSRSCGSGPTSRERRTASRRVHLHFHQAPQRSSVVMPWTAAYRDHDADGYGTLWDRVYTSSTRCRRSTGDRVRVHHLARRPVRSLHPHRPHIEGAVVDGAGTPVPGLYTTGWIKRGPVGLIESTKSDARRTVETLATAVPAPAPVRRQVIDDCCERGAFGRLGWDGWLRVDFRRKGVRRRAWRERARIVGRDELIAVANRTPARRYTAAAVRARPES